MFTGKKVIIFDMDGTLIDSIGMWNRVDRELELRAQISFKTYQEVLEYAQKELD